MSLEEGQQPSSLVKKRPFEVAFGSSQAIIESLLPQASNIVQSVTDYWQRCYTSFTHYLGQQIEHWQDDSEEETKRVPAKKKRRKPRDGETREDRRARRAERRNAREDAPQHKVSTNAKDSFNSSLRDVATQKKELGNHDIQSSGNAKKSVSNISRQTSLTDQLYNSSNHAPRQSLRTQLARTLQSRDRISSYSAIGMNQTSASPMYKGMFAASVHARRAKSSVLEARTPRDAANVLNRITPVQSRISKPSASMRKTRSSLPFTAANLSQYLESPSQASPGAIFRSPGAPLPSPAATFNPFKTKDNNNRMSKKMEAQSLEDLIAELRKEYPGRYAWDKIDEQKEARNIEIAKKRGLYKPVRSPIPIETAKRVEKALHGQVPHDQVLVDKFNQEIKVRDLSTLRATAWLNDEVINFYMNLIVERSKTTASPASSSSSSSSPFSSSAGDLKLHAFNTFFYPKLVKGGYKEVRRWAKKAKVDIAACDLILVPVHLGVHWCMASINARERRFEYWDSLSGGAGEAFAALRAYYAGEAPGVDITAWEDLVPRHAPQQRNGFDCGVFACQTAESLSRACHPEFSQDEMPELRKRMAASILDATLY